MYGANIFGTNSYHPILNGSIVRGRVFRINNSDTIRNGHMRFYRYRTPPTPMPLIGWAKINSDGRFSGYNIPGGPTIIVAAPNRNDHPVAVPTYVGNTVRWENATIVDLTNDTTGIEVNVKVFSPPSGGPGRISGRVVKGNINKMGPGDPLNGEDITIIAAGNPIDHQLTDALGKFSFPDLDNGTYDIYLNVTGVPVDNNSFEISTSNTSHEFIIVTVDSTNISFGDETGIKEPVSQKLDIGVYPNPASDQIYFEFEAKQHMELVLNIYYIDGRLTESRNIALEKGNWLITHTVSTYSTGIYIYNFKDDTGIISSGKINIISKRIH
ncbi:MAG: T9SS type A sorting domain-containing protein [Bacteroidetes bacterium]|nr:T9SS type A sorting domain-containing protein [Bacteroidota bacterium]